MAWHQTGVRTLFEWMMIKFHQLCNVRPLGGKFILWIQMSRYFMQIWIAVSPLCVYINFVIYLTICGILILICKSNYVCMHVDTFHVKRDVMEYATLGDTQVVMVIFKYVYNNTRLVKSHHFIHNLLHQQSEQSSPTVLITDSTHEMLHQLCMICGINNVSSYSVGMDAIKHHDDVMTWAPFPFHRSFAGVPGSKGNCAHWSTTIYYSFVFLNSGNESHLSTLFRPGTNYSYIELKWCFGNALDQALIGSGPQDDVHFFPMACV